MKTQIVIASLSLLVLASCGGATKAESTPVPTAVPTPAPTTIVVKPDTSNPSATIAIESFRKVSFNIPFGYRSAKVSLSDPKYEVEGQNMDVFMKTRLIPALVELVKVLPADKKLVINGYASAEGPENSGNGKIGNIALSEARAKAILDYIIKNSSLDRKRFIIRGHGSSSPLPGEAANSPKNRRVLIEIE